MDEHIFQVGQTVAYRIARWLQAAEGVYIVTAQRPERDGEREYRIKHSTEPFERSARETDLSLSPGGGV